jgi:hypothetical protein
MRQIAVAESARKFGKSDKIQIEMASESAMDAINKSELET